MQYPGPFSHIPAGQKSQEDWYPRQVATKMAFHLQIIGSAILQTYTYLFISTFIHPIKLHSALQAEF